MSDAIGDPTVKLECPDCGHAEQASLGPTLSIGFESDITITNVSCGRCGYDGPPDPEE